MQPDTSTPETDDASLAEAPTRLTPVPRGAQVSAIVRAWLIEALRHLVTKPEFAPLKGQITFDVGLQTIPSPDGLRTWHPVIACFIEIPFGDGEHTVYATPIFPATGVSKEGVETAARVNLERLLERRSKPLDQVLIEEREFDREVRERTLQALGQAPPRS